MDFSGRWVMVQKTVTVADVPVVGEIRSTTRAVVLYTLDHQGDKLRGAVLADLDPQVPGPEVATVGYERRLTILHREGERWKPTPVLRESEKFHGLAAGDLDGDGDQELVACGYSGRLIVIDRHPR